jgi:VanZ family protein
VVLWAGIIFGLSSISGSRLPKVDIPSSDKIAHIGVYSVLGALSFRAFRLTAPTRSRATIALGAIALSLVYGISDELHQVFTPDRTPDWHDVAADVIGGTLGVVASLIASWMKNRICSMMERSKQ